MRAPTRHGVSRQLPLAIEIATLTLGVAQAADAPAAESAPASRLTVIHRAHLIGTDAGKVLGATSIVVDGERIREMVPGSVDRDGAKVIDLPADHTWLPGLIDAHTHLTSQFSKSSYGDQFRLNPADYAIQSTNPQMTLAEIKAVTAAARDYGFTVAAHAHGAEAVLGGVESIEHGTVMDDEDMRLMKAGTVYEHEGAPT